METAALCYDGSFLLLSPPFLPVGLSDIEKSVVKATYDDELAPKEKHCVCQYGCQTRALQGKE